MNIAIAHPWFLMKGGAEKVVDILASMYPEADILTLFAKDGCLSDVIKGRSVIASPLNKVPWSKQFHFHMTSLFPWAVESLNVAHMTW